MAYLGLLMHASLAAAFTGGGALALRFVPGVLREDDPPRNVSRALTMIAILATMGGWVALAIVRDKGGLGFMVGLSIAAVAVKWGARLELRRLPAAGGTPVASMMKRATIFFTLLALLSSPLLAWGRARGAGSAVRWTLVLGLATVGLTAAVLWRTRPAAGPVAPAASVAARATFFGLAITALSAVLVSCAVIGFGGSDAIPRFATCVWVGIGVTSALMIATAWSATRLVPRTAIPLVGTVLGTLGLCLYGSL